MLKKLTIFITSLLLLPLAVVSVQAATLSLQPASTTVNSGASGSLKVILDTQGINSGGFDISLKYTGDGINFTSPTLGAEPIDKFFSVIQAESNPSTKTIRLVAANDPTAVEYLNGSNIEIATISYTTSSNGTIDLQFITQEDDSFDYSSVIGEIGEGQNYLTGTSGSVITIGSGGTGGGGDNNDNDDNDSGSSTNNDDNDDDNNDNDSSGSSNNNDSSTTTTTGGVGSPVPETGTTPYGKALGFSALLIIASVAIKKLFIA